jgi:hypothetical protein
VGKCSGKTPERVRGKVVATDGTVTDGAANNIAGVMIIDVSSLDEVLHWAAKLAAVLRCHKRSVSSRRSRPSATERTRRPSAAPVLRIEA